MFSLSHTETNEYTILKLDVHLGLEKSRFKIQTTEECCEDTIKEDRIIYISLFLRGRKILYIKLIKQHYNISIICVSLYLQNFTAILNFLQSHRTYLCFIKSWDSIVGYFAKIIKFLSDGHWNLDIVIIHLSLFIEELLLYIPYT